MPRKKDGEYARGWVPPGYDNLGPGNEVRIGPAGRSEGDAVARTHDIGYGEEEERGVNPYWTWVDADEEFLRDIPIEGPSTLIAKGLFSAKKVGKSIGVIGDMSGYKKRQTNLKAMPNKVKRKNNPKQPIKRKSPWEEGQEYREARENQAKRWREAFGNRPGEREHNAEAVAQLARDQEVDWEQETKQEEEPEPWENFTMDDVEQGWNEANMEGVDLSVANLPGNAEVMANEGEDDVDMGENAARSSGGGPNAQSKETAISSYPTLTYGLQETHTTILPFTYWFSAACSSNLVPSVHKIRLNSVYDFVMTSVAALAESAQPAAPGIYNRPVGPNGTGAYNSFPSTINDGTVVETPWWRNYWSQLYEYYTVLGCEYEIIIQCPQTSSGQQAMVGYTIDAYSTTATETGNITPSVGLAEAMSLKGMKFKVLESARAEDGNQDVKVIRGRYKPGMAKRNIVNDGDVKTWTKTPLDGSTSQPWTPTLTEALNLYFWRGPFAHIQGGSAGDALYTSVNVQVGLKWIVQFKDLRDMARYPRTTPAGTTVTQIISNTQTAFGNPIARWV